MITIGHGPAFDPPPETLGRIRGWLDTYQPPVDLDRLHLALVRPLGAGKHAPGQGDTGWCVLEAAAWVAGEPWSDHPECVCPDIGAFVRQWNDDLPDADRTRLLRPLIPEIIGTRGSVALRERRRWRIVDWLVRTYAPTWLDLAGLGDEAAALRALPEITPETIALAHPVVDAAHERSRAAARLAGIAVARLGANAATETGFATRAYRNCAASAAAKGAAGNAAVAWNGMWDAPRDTAWNARRTAWTAAWNAAGLVAVESTEDALRPTVKVLQASAVSLIGELCAMRDEEAHV